MSIMDLFRGKPAETALPPAQPQVSGTPGGQAPLQNPPLNSEAPQGQPAGGEGPSANPLDSFKDLWTPPKDGEGAPAAFDPTKMFEIDPVKIQQAVGQMNFANTLTPETLQKITNGGDEAAQAFATAMNQVAQQAFAQSMIGASKLVETALTKANDSLDIRMQEGIRKQQVSSSISAANPALNHAAAKPIVAALEAQFTQKYPTASPAEITSMAQDYLSKFAQLAAPATNQPAQKQGPQETDWEKYFTS